MRRRLISRSRDDGWSRQVFGLRIDLTGSFPGPCRTQWTSARSSPLPLRVSPGLRPGSLSSRSYLDRLGNNRTLVTRESIVAVMRCRCVLPGRLLGCGSRGGAWRGCWRCGLATVFVLSVSLRAISWLLSPLARRVKISSSLSVRTARIAAAAPSVVFTGMSSWRMCWRSLPAIWGESTDSPAAVARTALMMASAGALLRM